MSRPRILVAGVGNIFLGDDAFGVEVAQALARRELPEGVRVVDFGIRGLDLTYALLDGYDAVILADAAPRGGEPGTLYVIEPEIGGGLGEPAAVPDAHGMDPVKVMRLAAAMGPIPRRVFVVGCEPATAADAEDLATDLSEPVRAAVGEAVGVIESLVRRILGENAGGLVPGHPGSEGNGDVGA